jgi:SAM-dependent methyltransferase
MAGRAYVRRINRSRFEAQRFRRFNERPIELRFLFECLTDLQPRTVLDVGAGDTAVPALIANCGSVVTAIDNVRDYWPRGMVNRHWHVIDDDICRPRTADRFDMVTCISVIEHIEDHQAAFASMIRLLRPGGHLLLTTPYNETQPVANVYELPDVAYGQNLPYICRSASRAELQGWLDASGASVVRQEFWRLWTGDVWAQGDFLPKPECTAVDRPHQLTCLLVRASG